MSPRIWLGATLLLVVEVMTACGGNRASTVDVTEKEWTIKFANPTIKAGWVNFVVKNEGTDAHNLVIRGTSIEVAVYNIRPGKSKEISFDLPPGTYSVFCSIPGHEVAGMWTTLTVSP